MRKREITLQDGRYLIFYMFEDAPAPSPAVARNDAAAEAEPQAKNEAEEERRV